MERKTLKQFHRDLSWSTRIYTLLVILTILLSVIFDAWNTNWAFTVVIALALILFVESFAVAFYRHPKIWKTIRWMMLLILLALILIGAIR